MVQVPQEDKPKHGRLSSKDLQDQLVRIRARRERLLIDDLSIMMESASGRRIAYWMVFELCGLFQPSFEGGIREGQAAAMHMSKNEGMREVGARLQNKLKEIRPQSYLTMMAEAIETRQQEMFAEESARMADDKQRTEEDEEDFGDEF